MHGYGWIILASLLGFIALAALLLVPVYRFLKREEAVSDRWTEDERQRRLHRPPGENGTD